MEGDRRGGEGEGNSMGAHPHPHLEGDNRRGQEGKRAGEWARSGLGREGAGWRQCGCTSTHRDGSKGETAGGCALVPTPEGGDSRRVRG